MLQLLIAKVDADLFKCIELEDLKRGDFRKKGFGRFTGLKTGNVKDANEVDFLHRWVLTRTNLNQEKTRTIMSTHNQRPVAKINQPEEEAVVGRSCQGCYGIEALVSVLALVHPLSPNLKIII